MDWRILVTAPNGWSKNTITSTSAVAGIESMQMNGAGSCTEALLTALPGSVDLEPRDVIMVQTSLDGFTSVQANLWKGYISSAGTSRGSRLQQYRAVGLKQRAYEIILPDRVIAGADVAVMAQQVFTSRLGPGYVVGTDVVFGSLQALGFELGDRFPRLETAGDFLDALAESVGTFIVPPGETHEYAGVTFIEGERVPAVAWGTGPTGVWFFHRPLGETSANEATRGTVVEWQERSAEQVIDHVSLVYASAFPDDAEGFIIGGLDPVGEPVMQPLAYTSAPEDYNAGVVKNLEAPLTMMDRTVLYTSTWSMSGWTNPTRAWLTDGTYAERTGGDLGFIKMEVPTVHGGKGVIFQVDVQPGSVVAVSGQSALAVVDVVSVPVNSVTYTQTYHVKFPVGDADDRRLVYLPAVREVRAEWDIESVALTIWAGTGVRVRKMATYVIDDGVAARLAQAYERLPASEAAVVTKHEIVSLGAGLQAGSSVRTLNLTSSDGALVPMAVERIEYSLTVNEGARTIIHAGQAFDSGDEAERIVLERLARRAVTEGGPRR